MKNTPQRNRFEITIECNGEQRTHICTAQIEAGAIEKMARAYASLELKLVNVKRLGPLPRTKSSLREAQTTVYPVYW